MPLRQGKLLGIYQRQFGAQVNFGIGNKTMYIGLFPHQGILAGAPESTFDSNSKKGWEFHAPTDGEPSLTLHLVLALPYIGIQVAATAFVEIRPYWGIGQSEVAWQVMDVTVSRRH